MDETTPRPIPPQLLGVYRNPIDLRGLLGAIFSPEQQVWVRDELLRRVIERHGNLAIPVADATKYRTQPLSQRVRSFRSSPVKGIEYLVALEDIGGRAKGQEGAEHSDMLLLLAEIMQPRWEEWWNTFRDARYVGRIGKFVLGDGQLRWLAAQFARTVFGDVTPANRKVMLKAITTAEAHALGRATDAELVAASLAAARAAAGAADGVAVWAVNEAAARAAYWGAIIASEATDWAAALARLADLARCLFGRTPALITRAYGSASGRAVQPATRS